MSTALISVYCTYPSLEEAQKSAQILLEKGLIACANIGSPVLSIYRWQEEIQSEKEYSALFKTHVKHWDSIVTEINEHHSYDCPCIVAWPINLVHSAYEQWVLDEVNQ